MNQRQRRGKNKTEMTQKGNAVTDIPTEAETKQREKLFPNYTRVCREAEEGIIPDISKQNGKKDKTQKDHRRIGGERDVGSKSSLGKKKKQQCWSKNSHHGGKIISSRRDLDDVKVLNLD